VKPFVEPPLCLFLLFGVGLLIAIPRRKTGLLLSSVSALLLVVLCMPLTSALLLQALECAPPLDVASLDHGAGAIVILGADLESRAPEYGGPTVGGMTLERVRYGAWLQRRCDLPILVSGGPGREGTPPVAELMRAVLEEEFGAKVRWSERGSATTWENAHLSARILSGEGVRRIYLVTHAWHLRRARACFEYLGLEVVPAPTLHHAPRIDRLGDWLPSAKGLRQSAFAIHEGIGLLWYRVRHF
jgi:uncharacterized SAM-binding protein YcdF (DUF218 family)